jgi:hypothetical protein
MKFDIVNNKYCNIYYEALYHITGNITPMIVNVQKIGGALQGVTISSNSEISVIREINPRRFSNRNCRNMSTGLRKILR